MVTLEVGDATNISGRERFGQHPQPLVELAQQHLRDAAFERRQLHAAEPDAQLQRSARGRPADGVAAATPLPVMFLNEYCTITNGRLL